jgi:hypothetical protein
MVKSLITHADLVVRARKWLYNRCTVVLTEYRSYSPVIPDAIGFNNAHSIVVECKISREDFKADLKKPHRQFVNQLGNYRYYLVLPHTVCSGDVPDNWGLLYVTDKKILTIKKAPFISNNEVKVAEWQILFSLARRIKENGLMEKAMEKF